MLRKCTLFHLPLPASYVHKHVHWLINNESGRAANKKPKKKRKKHLQSETNKKIHPHYPTEKWGVGGSKKGWAAA